MLIYLFNQDLHLLATQNMFYPVDERDLKQKQILFLYVSLILYIYIQFVSLIRESSAQNHHRLDCRTKSFTALQAPSVSCQTATGISIITKRKHFQKSSGSTFACSGGLVKIWSHCTVANVVSSIRTTPSASG